MATQSTEEILEEYEELFAKRYTEEDPEYMKAVNKTAAPPPCIPDWLNAGYSRGRDDRRDRYNQGQGRYGDRHQPYQRNERQGGGRYGDRHGDRHDDRSRHDNRKKAATEYGSQGYFQYYY